MEMQGALKSHNKKKEHLENEHFPIFLNLPQSYVNQNTVVVEKKADV